MLQDYSREEATKSLKNRPKFISVSLRVAAYISLVVISFFVAQQAVILLIKLVMFMGVPVVKMGGPLINAVFSVLIYLITIAIAIGIPWFIKKQKTSRREIGLHRLPSWMDIWIAPAGFVIYIIISIILSSIATAIFPWFNAAQQQDVGFTSLNFKYEYLLAFLTLVVVAPIAEEVLFRGYLFGKLRKFIPVWLAIILTSLTFGIIHGAWNLGIDTFALSLVLCSLRLITGSLWAPILLHMIKNGIAFYILFINPTFFTTLGG